MLVDAEREARPVSEVPGSIKEQHGETEIILSTITVIEMEHGFHRANLSTVAFYSGRYIRSAQLRSVSITHSSWTVSPPFRDDNRREKRVKPESP